MKELTTIQKKTLRWIISFIDINGYPPTVRDGCRKFTITTKAVQDRLTALRKKEYINWTDGKYRTIRVLKEN